MPPEPTARQVGERFSMQHDGGLREVVWTHVRRNWDAWCLTDGVEAKKRSVRSLSAGGASGTGKTRFGSELPQLLWRAAELDAHTPPQLCTALDACRTRKYVLKFAFSRSRDPPSLPDSFTYAADLLWAAYMDAFFGGERIATPGVSTADVYDAISRIERNAVPNALPSVIAVVVHLDEVQNCLMTPERLGHLVSSLLSPFDAATPPSHGIIPLIYLSGVNKLQFTATPLTENLVSLSLPLLTGERYAAILRDLFKLTADWSPKPPLMRALCSIEGPPRLLELLLWAMQASGVLTAPLISTRIDLEDVKRQLRMTWEESLNVLYRAVASLGQAGVMVHQESLLNERLGPVVRCVMGHVLLGSVLQLSEPLVREPPMTTNDVIKCGLAQSLSVPNSNGFRLHWPRLYFWAIYKVPKSHRPSLTYASHTVQRRLGSPGSNDAGDVSWSAAGKRRRRGTAT